MTTDSKNKYLPYFLILLTACLLCFINLGGYPVYILDEAKNSEAAREMLVNNNWIVPTFNGELRVDKPPLHYWFMMLAFKIFGVGTFAARFFSAFFGVLTIMATFHFTQRFTNRRTAALTALVLCSAFFFVQEFHLAVPDPYLIFFVSFALFNFYDFWKTGRRSSWLYFYISLGLGILAKGPVALALPGIILLVFLIWKKEFNLKSILNLQPFLGGFITLGIAVPWFVKVHLATNGEFTNGFFLEHNLNRFTGEMEGHGGLPVVTLAFILLGLLPFSFFIIQGFIRSWKVRKTNDFILFSWIVAMVFMLFFAISMTKLPNYPMPSYPFIAVLIAVYLNEVYEKKIALKGFKISLWTLFAITLLMPFGAYIVLALVEKQLYATRFLSILLFILPAGTALALFYLYKGKILKCLLAIGFSAMFFSLELHQFIYPNLTAESPMVMAKNLMNSDEKTIVYKSFDPALLFNYERNIPVRHSKEGILDYLKENPETMIITKNKYFDADWKDESTEILLMQKALFENYTLIIFKLK